MDIQNINALTQSAKSTRQKSTDDACPSQFQTYLDQFSGKSVQENAPKAQSPGNISNVQPIPFINITTPQQEMAEKVDSVLDLLDTYSQDLKNPNKTLKEIEPALLNMKQAAEKLYNEHQEGNSQELTQFISQLHMTASVEYFKFQRGDYI